VNPLHRQQTAAHCLESLPFTYQLLPLPTEGSLAFLLFTGHTHHAERLAIAPHVAVQSLTQRQRVNPVRLHPLAPLVPVLRLHHQIAHPQRLELAVQVVAEGTGLVAGVDFAGERLLFGHEAQQRLESHLLDRLRGGPVQLSRHVIPLRMGVDTEFDRVVGFVCLCLVVSYHGYQAGGFSPRLTTHVI